MRTVRYTRRHADQLVGDSAARRFRIFLSVSETWKSAGVRRVGRVGPEYQSSRRGRGEQRRPLRRRVGNMGACPPPLRGRSAVLSPNAADPSGGPKIDSHVDFDSTAAWRHHVSMLPSSRSQSAATTALAGGTLELFRVKMARNHSGGFWGAVGPLRLYRAPWQL